jgi:hypothetical protein
MLFLLGKSDARVAELVDAPALGSNAGIARSIT